MAKLLTEPSDHFIPQLVTLGNNLNLIDRSKDSIDCSQLTWVSPLSVLPIAARLYKKQLPVHGINSYLQTIAFPNGIDDPDFIPKGKTYLPLIRFPTKPTTLTEKITTEFIRLVLSYIGFGKLITNAFHYAVDEMVTNICEHSQSNHGWMLAQYYPSKEFLDMVILDQGMGFKSSYEAAFEKTYSDEQAIQEALAGISIKKDLERGYGLRTTKKLVTQSPLKGNFLIISGKKGFFSEKNRELFFNLETWAWQGAIIIMRLKRVTHRVNCMDYVE